ncbi:sulfotransferase 1C4-like isoform X2 [Ptychodera flava]|uniref:sulfotransferase 1C4-like isoform X2 n=1 Tax=Ptychodera flava TaxID=63121 RepID=UPI003969D7B8
MVDYDTISNSGRKLSLDKIRNFKIRDDDILIITFVKSGTTWMKEIISLILNGGNIDAVKDIPIDVRVPYLEFALSADEDRVCAGIQRHFMVPENFSLDEMASPRAMNTHLRPEFLPAGIEQKKTKIIYVARNPKDIAVSMYHFGQLLLEQNVNNSAAKACKNFEEFITDFLEFKSRYQAVAYDGSKWHEHVLTWWNRRHDDNVLFMKYEDLLRDLANGVHQIAQFLDIKLTDDVVKNIADHCCFNNMKKNKMALKSNYCENKLQGQPENISPFVRKGIAGGWKKYFTVAQNERFDECYRTWLKDSDLEMTFAL